LARSGRDFTDDGEDKGDDNDSNHNVGANVAACDIVEELNEGEPSLAIEESGRIGDDEAQRNNCKITQKRIESDSPHQSSWKSARRIFDFFGY